MTGASTTLPLKVKNFSEVTPGATSLLARVMVPATDNGASTEPVVSQTRSEAKYGVTVGVRVSVSPAETVMASLSRVISVATGLSSFGVKPVTIVIMT